MSRTPTPLLSPYSAPSSSFSSPNYQETITFGPGEMPTALRGPSPSPRRSPAPARTATPRRSPAPAVLTPDQIQQLEAQADVQDDVLVMFPLADGRVKAFRGKYSGQTMMAPDGQRFKPGYGTRAFYNKQALNATRKAATAPVRQMLGPNDPAPLDSTKMVTDAGGVPPIYKEMTTYSRQTADLEKLRTVGRVGLQRGQTTRYGRRPRATPRSGVIQRDEIATQFREGRQGGVPTRGELREMSGLPAEPRRRGRPPANPQ